MRLSTIVVLGALAMMATGEAQADTLTIYAAGTLAGPFREIDGLFAKANPGVTVEPQFGGSVMMAKRITELHQQADILAVADYSVIPKYFPAAWYVGFARNAVTFVYTAQSKGASAAPTPTPIPPAIRRCRC
jgi:molybdate/tungstate transport system substrate-binding protein